MRDAVMAANDEHERQFIDAAGNAPSMDEHEDDLDYLTGLTLQRNDDAVVDGGNGAKSGQRGRRYFLKRNADPELVISACTRKLAADPGEIRALYIRATCFFKLGRYTNAEEDLSLFLKSNANDVQAVFLRGRVREKVRPQGTRLENGRLRGIR